MQPQLIEAKLILEIEIQSIMKVQQKNLKNIPRERKAKNWTTARSSHSKVLNVALKEIETKIPLITSELKYHEIQSKVIGYQIRNR